MIEVTISTSVSATFLISVILNMMLGFFWYGVAFGWTWMQLIARDKGIVGSTKKKISRSISGNNDADAVVRSPGAIITKADFEVATKARWPYPDSYCFGASFSCNMVKTWCLWYCLHLMGDTVKCLLDALLLAASLSLIHMVSVHQYFWQGRPIQFMMLDYGYEVTGMLLTATILYFVPALVG